MKARRNKRRVQDLAVKSARAVKGGSTSLMLACASGQHIKEATRGTTLTR